MKLKADKNGNPRFLSAKLGRGEQLNCEEFDMLVRRDVPMLISPTTVQGRSNNIVRFDISPYTTLAFYLSLTLTRQQAGELLLQCVDVFRQMKRACLSYEKLVMDLEKVYILLEDRNIHFVYLPVREGVGQGNVRGFLLQMVGRMVRSSQEILEFINDCNQWLTRPSGFVLEEFAEFIRKKMYHDQRIADRPPVNDEPPEPHDRYYDGPPPRGSTGPTDKPADKPRGGGSTTVLPSSETTELNRWKMTPTATFYLWRERTEEKVKITTSPFLVGSEMGASYCITDNEAISRRHAQFIVREGECWVTDQGSTNKTYLNGERLAPQVNYILKNGDRLRLANEYFTFIREER